MSLLLFRVAACFGLVLFLASAPARAAGLVTKESAHSVAVTLDRLAALLEENGVAVMARVDHAANAQSAGLELRPTELLIFGDPGKGTLLMQENQAVAIDLPMKALAWQDADGRVWLAYVSPVSIAQEHGIPGSSDTVAAMEAALGKLTDGAIAP
jgi:uncharacterized protein (DUF302 family)